MPIPKWTYLLVITALGLGSALYSHDLRQKNPETIFLTKEGSKSYSQFKKIAPEKKTVVVQVIYPREVHFEDFLDFEKELSPILTKCENLCELVTPRNLARSPQQLKERINSHFKNTTGPLNLSGKNYFSFILIEKENENTLKNIIEQIIDQRFFKNGKRQVYMTGTPYINYLLDRYSKSIKDKLFPLMFLISFLIILLITQSLTIATLIFLPSLFSATISLASIKLLFGQMNMITSIVPLISFTISLSLGFHLFYSLIEYKSFKQALRAKLTPTLLMVLTTVIGFGSLVVSKILVIQHFGMLSASLILMTSFLSFIWYSGAEKIFLKYYRCKKSKFNLAPLYFSRTLPINLITTLAIISIIFSYIIYEKIPIVTDATRYFHQKTGIKESIDQVSRTVTGLPVFEVVIHNKESYLLDDYKKFFQLEKIFLKEQSNLEQNYKILSLSHLISESNFSYSGSRDLPEHMISLNALFSRLPHSMQKSYPIESNYRLSFLGAPINVDQYKKDLKKLKYFLKSHGIKNYVINGLYYNLMYSQEAMISVLSFSFIISLTLICLVAFIALRKRRILTIFFLVNIIPVAISVILLWCLNLSLNIATVMTYSISLGLIVDSSFHLIHALNRKDNSFNHFIQTTIKPIIGSSFLFIVSFSLFALNDFLPIKQFGINLSIIIFLGLLFDLYILPTLYLGHTNLKEVFNE